MKTSSTGFVYVATGSGYPEEARRSAASLRQIHPHASICLITDQSVSDPIFDHVIQITNAEHRPIDKLLAIRCPYERAVFLDTDTRVCGDLLPLFAVLERFDLALLQDVHRGWDYPMEEVPPAFSEFNTGVIAFRNTPRVHSFFESWRDTFRELHRTLGLVNDQPAFRKALFLSDLRIAPLPGEFHFLGNFPNYLMWKARLIHARGNLTAFEKRINEAPGGRVYLPDVGTMTGFRGRGHWLRQMIRSFLRMARLLFFPPADSAGENPRKWWLPESAAQTADPSHDADRR